MRRMFALQCIINCKRRRRKRLWPHLRHYPEFSWRNTRKPGKTSARVVCTATETRLGPFRVKGWTVIAWAKLLGECLTAHRPVLTEMEETWTYGRISSLSIGFTAGCDPSRYREVGRPKHRLKEHQHLQYQEENILLHLNLNGLLLFIYLFWSHGTVTGSQYSTVSLTKHFSSYSLLCHKRSNYTVAVKNYSFLHYNV